MNAHAEGHAAPVAGSVATARSHGEFWRIAGKLVSIDIPVRLLNVGLTVLLIRLLPIAEYGLYAYYLSVATMAVAVISSGVQIVYLRRQAYLVASGAYDGALFGLSLLVIVGLHVAGSALALALLGAGALTVATLVLAFFQSVFAFLLAHYQAIRELRRYAILNIGKNVLTLVLVGLVACSRMRALEVLWALALVHAVLVGAVAGRLRNFLCGARLRMDVVKGLLVENGYLFFYYGLIGVYSQVDILFLERRADPTALGLYGAAVRYQSLALLLLGPLVNSIRVFTSSPDIAGSTRAERSYFQDWMRKVAIVGLPQLVLAEVLTPWLLPLVSGAKYAPAVPVFQLLLVGAFVTYLFAPANSLMIGRSGYKALAAIGAIGLACRAAGASVASSTGSVVALALSATAATVVLNILPAIYVAGVLWRRDARS